MKTLLLLSTLALCAADFAERPDPWITGKVRSAFAFQKSVSGLKIEVEASGGVVTLRGVADYEAQKDLAAEYAAEIEGVRSVTNLMTVKGERTGNARGGKVARSVRGSRGAANRMTVE
ncbi:MAG: BON domain-containing protein [Elusimicrobia bacterium]|nr:BON domain-containing protein [Elusimicrobiota bacterium]